MEDADFCVSMLKLISDARYAFLGVKDASGLLTKASSYASTAHMELSLAAS